MTTAGKHLLRRETPLGGESFAGYLTRMAQNNGCDSVVWLLSASGMCCKHGVSTDFLFGDSSADLVGLASLLGLDASELLTLAYPRPASKDARTDYTFFGQRIQQYVLRPDRPKICPICLGEAAHSRRIWECSLVTACPRHSRLLIDHCPGCDRRISWLRAKVCVCDCGYDWREAAPTKPLPDEELALSKYVHQLCGVETAGEEANRQPPSNPLFTLSLRGLVSAVTFIASQFRGISCSTGRYITSTAQNDALHETFSRVYRVFEDWPARYHEFLGQHHVRAGESGKRRSGVYPSLSASFGRIYSGLYTTLEAPEFDFMRAGFASYVFTQWAGQTTTLRSRAKHPPSHLLHPGKYITGTEARHLLEVSGYHLAYLIKTGQLRVVTHRKKRSRSLSLIEAKDLVKLKSRFDQSIGLNEVSDRLNATPDVTLELVGNGSLTALRGPFADVFREWRFAPDAPERLLEEIRHRFRTGTRTTACSCPTASTTHTFFSMVESARGGAGLSVGRLVRAVLDGFVRPCEETQTDKGLSRFRLDETAFHAFEASEGILRGEPSPHFTGVDGLTDEQWTLVGRLLRKPRYRGAVHDDDAHWDSREVIAGIWWVLSNRAEWHALPGRFPPAQTCYEWMKAWICPKRVFKKALDILARDLRERGRVDHTHFICDGYGLELKGGQSRRRMPRELRAHDSWQRRTLLALLSYYKYSLFNHQNMPPIML